ncbi:MAG: hypothetical protein E3K37_09365 [Candidatus Kuenenia sp.]|nr:hypothetical protein [Candidatus Kuenenia hertensis]
MVVNNVDLRGTILGKESGHLRVRKSLYQILSACFLYPTAERFSFFKHFEFIELVNNIDDCYKKECIGETGSRMMRLLVSFQNTTISELQRTYLQGTGHVISTGNPLSEIEHGQSHVFQHVQVLVNVEGFYKAFVLDMPEEKKGRKSHISVALEFMQFLLQKHVDALNNHETQETVLYMGAQKKFLKVQAGEWIRLFAMLSEKKKQEGFYYDLAELAKEFVRLEMKLLELKTAVYKGTGATQKIADLSDESLPCPFFTGDIFMG